jgi:CBS domain containing-hemolysin-like protein
MAATGLTRFPVVARDDPHTLVGMISLQDILKGRALNLEVEQRQHARAAAASELSPAPGYFQ